VALNAFEKWLEQDTKDVSEPEIQKEADHFLIVFSEVEKKVSWHYSSCE
jgi:hypothetical protein